MKKFEEINDLLNEIRGGAASTFPFDGIIDPNGIRHCQEKDCKENCMEKVAGTYAGNIEGIVEPGPLPIA